MTIAKHAQVELRAGRHGLSAWVDSKWLGKADVIDDTVTITMPARNLLPSVQPTQAKRVTADWNTNMDAAPRDRLVNVVGRYLGASSGHVHYALFVNGQWWEITSLEPQPLVCWAWREIDGYPSEADHVMTVTIEPMKHDAVE